uniref:Uncharacterized protein n=1 Tax=Compsopogon caeruleus TaxID=31354 RepID=A0A6T6CI20_9RHOD|mmetsp:Transcript_6193/g.12167  ORF Transcript_6193/g.12167 Transcript_6193/m.12167 type:complete len:883 (+) Transcript_6193:1655-4303(+)
MGLQMIWIGILVTVLFFVQVTDGTVMGIDLGGQFMKVSLVRPGAGIELVTNEQAKRKTPAAIAFTRDQERLFGDAAVAYAGKDPDRVLMNVRGRLGQCDPEGLPEHCRRMAMKVADEYEFFAEEVASMLISLARQQAAAYLTVATGKKFLPTAIKDVVVAVPAWFGERERNAIADAVEMAGMNLLATINVNTAAAIKYILDTPAENAELKESFMMVDIGFSGTTVTIGSISRGKDPQDKISLQVLSHAWDQTLGSSTLDDLIAEHLGGQFDEKRGQSASPKSKDIPKVMSRLRKEAGRIREILSANTEAFCSVEALYDDIDFTGHLTRAEFEEMAEPIFGRVGNPIRKALNAANRKVSDIQTVIPFGGVTRIPRLQELILKESGRDSLNKGINADEAAVMGAAFLGATLSAHFRVRKMDIFDILPYRINAEIEREMDSGKPPQRAELFREGSKVPSKKVMTIKRVGAFNVSVFMEKPAGNSKLLGSFSIEGVEEVFKKLRNMTIEAAPAPKVALTFEVDRSGLVQIQKSEVTLEEVVTIEREVEVKKSTPQPKKDTKDAKPKGSEEPAASSEAPKEYKTEKVQQTLVHRVFPSVLPIAEDGAIKSFMLKMNRSAYEESIHRLRELDAAELRRKRQADVLNGLEGYILEVRGLLSDDVGELVTTETERDSMKEKLNDAEDWLYTDESKSLDLLESKDKSIRQVCDPFLERIAEHERRPEVVSQFRERIELMKNSTEMWYDLHEKVNSTHMEAISAVLVSLTEAEEWFNSTLAAQDALEPHETPVLRKAEVEVKLAVLQREVQIILRKLPPIVPSKEPTQTKNTKQGEGDENTTEDFYTNEPKISPNPSENSTPSDEDSSSTENGDRSDSTQDPSSDDNDAEEL